MTDPEAVSKELKAKIRGYEGLSAKKLAGCPHTLEALGTTDPLEAVERFKAVVGRLPDDKFTEALKNAIGLGAYRGSTLTERQIPYKSAKSASVDAIREWEERGIETLAAALTAPPEERLREIGVAFPVIAVNQKPRVAGMLVISMWMTAEGNKARTESREVVNNGLFNVPFAPYSLGADEHPERLRIGVGFEPGFTPTGVYAFGDLDAFSFFFGTYERLKVTDESMPPNMLSQVRGPAAKDMKMYEYLWENPMPGRIYGLGWINEPDKPSA